MWDENFLRFLTIQNRISNIEDSLLYPLYKKIPLTKVLSWGNEHARDISRARDSQKAHIYVHIPFCERTCLYCHCAKYRLRSRTQLVNYYHQLKRQVESWAPLYRGISFQSLFLGGGTPSVLPDKDLQEVFDLLNQHFTFAPAAQVSVEVTPSSLTKSKAQLFFKNGVNRISVGIQSFDSKVLTACARYQPISKTYRTFEILKDAGFKIFNIDLMAGLPEQTEASFLRSLRKAVRFLPNTIQLNPYCDIEQTDYVKHNPSIQLLELLRVRAKMVSRAKEELHRCGYAPGDFGFFHRKNADYVEHAQQLGVTKAADSLLGFGPFAHSRLVGYGAWMALPVNSENAGIYYKGMSVELRYYMAEYVVKNLWKGFEAYKFQELFGHNMEEIFCSEIEFLKQKAILGERNDKFYYKGPRSLEGVFNYYTYTKILYGNRIINGLRKKYKGTYCSDEKYAWGAQAFRTKMQDTVFMMTASGLGF